MGTWADFMDRDAAQLTENKHLRRRGIRIASFTALGLLS
jgi:hypothetical protein